uniref:Uncharacterized protein n=1 Tax=Rhizophora mucronata TaxID=61149 RepID=A0A2P2QHM6_RHIMU
MVYCIVLSTRMDKIRYPQMDAIRNISKVNTRNMLVYILQN